MTEPPGRPSTRQDALRLNMNENTAGCSPAVLDAIRLVTRTDVSFYPTYSAVTCQCARDLGVDPDWVLLTNGLDEGILCAMLVAFRASAPRGRECSTLVVDPSFEMYSIFTRALGASLVRVPPAPNFSFPLERVRAAAAVDFVCLTNPNNPTGQLVSNDDVAAVAGDLPAGALLLLDEAYIQFGGRTFVPRLADHPNVIVGRTFAKAYGLAGIRAGCLIARPETLEPIRALLPPYSVNALAVTALKAALTDRDYVTWYCEQVDQSRRLLYDSCDRLGLEYWPSAANFVLIRVGDDVQALIGHLAARGILVRDRSSEPGCEGCLRITAGVVDHTRRCLAEVESFIAARG
jgi:histidinol-phosphate aminotransferase